MRAQKAEREKWNPIFIIILFNGEKIVTDYVGMMECVRNGTEYTEITTDSELYVETAALWTVVYGRKNNGREGYQQDRPGSEDRTS